MATQVECADEVKRCIKELVTKLAVLKEPIRSLDVASAALMASMEQNEPIPGKEVRYCSGVLVLVAVICSKLDELANLVEDLEV